VCAAATKLFNDRSVSTETTRLFSHSFFLAFATIICPLAIYDMRFHGGIRHAKCSRNLIYCHDRDERRRKREKQSSLCGNGSSRASALEKSCYLCLQTSLFLIPFRFSSFYNTLLSLPVNYNARDNSVWVCLKRYSVNSILFSTSSSINQRREETRKDSRD